MLMRNLCKVDSLVKWVHSTLIYIYTHIYICYLYSEELCSSPCSSHTASKPENIPESILQESDTEKEKSEGAIWKQPVKLVEDKSRYLITLEALFSHYTKLFPIFHFFKNSMLLLILIDFLLQYINLITSHKKNILHRAHY